jgi:protein TonB
MTIISLKPTTPQRSTKDVSASLFPNNGYDLARRRWLIAATGFSLLAHAGVFALDWHGERSPEHAKISYVGTVCTGFSADEPEPTPAPEPVDNPERKSDELQGESGPPSACLPESGARPEFGGVEVKIDHCIPRVPDPGNLRWKPPSRPGPTDTSRERKVFDAGDLDRVPVPTARISPRYPAELRRSGISGAVLLRFVVDEHGVVESVQTVRADNADFSPAAEEALRQWKFKPGMKNGRRVATRMEIPMNFSVDRGV